MGIDSTAYKIVFVLHLMTAIAGFGGVLWNGVYGAQAKQRQGVVVWPSARPAKSSRSSRRR